MMAKSKDSLRGLYGADAVKKAVQIVGGPTKAATIMGVARRTAHKFMDCGLPVAEWHPTQRKGHARKLAAASNGAFTEEDLLARAAKPAKKAKAD